MVGVARRFGNFDLIYPCVLLYFLTLHADQLSVAVGGNTIRLNNLIGLFLSVLLIVRFRSRLFFLDKELGIALLGIMGSMVLSLAFSSYKQRCFLFFSWYCLTLVCNFFLPYFLIKMGDPKKILSLFINSFVLVGLYALAQLLLSCLGIKDPFAEQRLMPGIVRPNAFAYEPSFYVLYMTPCIMLINAHCILTPKEPFLNNLTPSLTKILCLNFCYLISFSTSAIFAYLLFFIVVLFFAWKQKTLKRLFKFLLSFVALCGLFFVFYPSLWKKFFLKFFYEGFLSHNSFYERWMGICNAWQIFMENLYIGVGFGGVPPYLLDAWLDGDSKFYFFENTLRDLTTKNLYKFFEPMNVFTEILASLGVVGCFAFGLFLVLFFLKVVRSYQKVPSLSTGICVAAIVTLITLQFNQGVLRTYIWNFLGLAFALLEHPLPLAQHKPFYDLRQKAPESRPL